MIHKFEQSKIGNVTVTYIEELDDETTPNDDLITWLIHGADNEDFRKGYACLIKPCFMSEMVPAWMDKDLAWKFVHIDLNTPVVEWQTQRS